MLCTLVTMDVIRDGSVLGFAGVVPATVNYDLDKKLKCARVASDSGIDHTKVPIPVNQGSMGPISSESGILVSIIGSSTIGPL